MEHINNLPDYAYEYPFIVVRICDGEFWFWGAFEKNSKAFEVASEIGGTVVYNTKVRE
jgi:hypothetical protein